MSRDTIRLPRDAYRLLQTLRAAGHSAYVVGGCVRDSLLGRLPGDWDICTSARPDQLRAIFHDQRLILTGEKHGTVAVILHGKPQQGASIDDGIAAMRALVAIARSAESGQPVRLADVEGGV